MFILFLIILHLISADNNNTSIIYIHEELLPNSLLMHSISSTASLHWLPSSYIYQNYFHLKQNQSLYTTDQRIDREEFCQKNLCNCSFCVLTLNFLQTFSTDNVSIRTIKIVVEGKQLNIRNKKSILSLICPQKPSIYLDINDYAPTFKQSFIKLPIAENVPIGYEIPLESVIDDDYGLFSIQSYELHPSINNPFRLIHTGKPTLKLIEPLDREIKSNYLLQIIAYDGGSPPLSGQQKIEIIVTEYVSILLRIKKRIGDKYDFSVNDNPPVFDRSIYQQKIPENNQIDTTILQIHASDHDEGENARIRYSIDDSSSTFRINEYTGELYLIKFLDYEKIRSHSISIIGLFIIL